MNANPPAPPARPRALLVGATAGLGRALAGTFAAAGWNLVLTGRDADDLTALASDLRLRHGVEITEKILDLSGNSQAWNLQACCAGPVPLNVVLLPAGSVHDDDSVHLPEADAATLLQANFLGLAQVVTQVLPLIARDGRSVIVGFGSIAATRGRRRNLYYSAAKRALTSYFEGLRHELQAHGVRAQFYIPGYLDTNLAAGLTSKLPKASPGRLASIVLANLHKDFGIRYFPFWWGPLCVLLRFLPWAVYRRLRF